MNDAKYIGMDVHQATISVAVRDSRGNLVMEAILETKAETILQFIRGLRGSLYVTFEEGTWAAWLYDLLQPHVTRAKRKTTKPVSFRLFPNCRRCYVSSSPGASRAARGFVSVWTPRAALLRLEASQRLGVPPVSRPGSARWFQRLTRKDRRFMPSSVSIGSARSERLR